MEAAAAAGVEVSGIPAGVAEELLVLYFENRRRSGGGPVQSCRRRGARARIDFESPDDACRVLSRGSHSLQGAQLSVAAAAPRDWGKVVLRGLSGRGGTELLERDVEQLLGCPGGGILLRRSPDGDLALLQLPQPLTPHEFVALAERVRNERLPEPSGLELDWVAQTDSVLVAALGGGAQGALSQDLLELYFESKRSGGGPVRDVRLLPGATGAVVSFSDYAVVDRVLQKSHQLQGHHLDVSPHYDFLEPPEDEETATEAAASPEDAGIAPSLRVPLPDAATRRLLELDLVLRELGARVPECALRLEGGELCISGGDAAGRQRLQESIQEALRGAAQEHLPFSAWVLGFLQRADVGERLAELLSGQGLGACYVPAEEGVLVVAVRPAVARQAMSLLGSALASFSLPLSDRRLLALALPRWAQVEAGLRCCLVRLAEGGARLEGLTLRELEEENVAHLEAFLQDGVPDETVVAMEAGALRYLQLYSQEILTSIGNVTLLPLEGADVTGFRLSGTAGACQAAAELLQSLAGAIHTQTLTLQLPGISRFLLDSRGQAVVRDLERHFRCVVGLERVRWSPVLLQHELEMSQTPLALSCRRDSLRRSEQPPALPDVASKQSEANMEEIKGLLVALRPAGVGAPAEGRTGSDEAEGEDLYSAPEPEAAAPSAVEEEKEAAGWGEEESLEEGPLRAPTAEAAAEEAELLLAIQQSMDSAQQEEEELRQATELSLRSYQEEAVRGASPDAALQAVLSISLEEAHRTANSAQLGICAASEADTVRVAQELEAQLRAQLREETVHNEGLCSLPPLCLEYLAHLERKHAVRISLDGAVATVCGFADYPVAATRDLALLLTRLLRAEVARGSGGVRWVHWDSSGGGSPTPYSAEASALLEQAWCRGHKRVDVFFDGYPFTIDFERMEEYDIGNARTLPIGRTEQPVAPPAPPSPTALAGDEVKLLLLPESSEEFQGTVRQFYGTLEDFHNKIRIIKVQKVLHPLLYQQYLLKRGAMEKACGRPEVERLLYHGTTEQSSREICQFGFNRSFCGKNATRYGHGVYFAVQAYISVQEQYSPSSTDGNKYIFVTRTLVGDYTTGSHELRAPPLREGDSALRRYDSVVDNLRAPSIFVIFNDTQAYPQYLITCQRSRRR
ncbi:protein mono-ADP-ribosyltransferase PARP10 [Sphaerodactylus townsendi]|uniref:protein mono-ADP-ribosyltransferase PARP10 n=1 Tax=Sphaerodactylus townsendi TaxID=933632 RepID=UPI0020274B47|nr:protein mono-ADP-ribosyltransferase PARP10 [Sphaerodactylus townsendi]